MTVAEPQERQREHRHRVLKGASIIQGINDSEIKVTIRNLNAGGAELRVPLGAQVPSEFLLYIPIDRAGYRCSVCWRNGDRIGIQFIEKAAKPHWHYG